jgi:hypothetical protein
VDTTVTADAEPLAATTDGGDGVMVFAQQYLITGPKLSRYRKPMRRIVPAKRRR